MRERRTGMRRVGGLWLAAMCLASSGYGQALPPQLPPGPLTLEAVLEIAEARSEAIRMARAGITRAEADGVRARSGLFPQLTGSASYERALASEFEGVFESTGPTCPPFMLDPAGSIEARLAEVERAIDCGAVGSGFFGAPADESGDGGFEDLPFGRENTWRASLSLSQNLYSGGRIGAQVAVAAAAREAADLTLTTARGQLRFEATQAFYEAALSSRLFRIAEATLEQADATLRQVQAGFDAGTQPEFEVLRARVTRDNQMPELIRQRVNREVALLRLKQLLDVPPMFELQLADPFADEVLAPPPAFAVRVAAVERAMQSSDIRQLITQGLSASLPDRAAVNTAAAQLRQNEAAFDLAAAQRRPTASLFSNYSRVAYPSNAFSGFDNWRTNWTLGASVELPILTGGRQRGDEMAARAAVQESAARLQQVEELAGLDTRLAWAELLAARATWEASAGTVEQAARAYEIADVRYQAGVSTQLELTDSRLLLQQAEANRARAARDLQVARARVALLPELPLTVGAGGASAPQAPAETPQVPSTPQQPFGAGGLRAATGLGAQTQAGR